MVTLRKIGAALAVLAACLLPQICGASTESGSQEHAQRSFFVTRDAATSASSSPQLFACAAGTKTHNEAISPSRIPIGLTMADFTGDGNPDLAAVEVESSGISPDERYQIEIQLTEGGRQFLEVKGRHGRLFITAKDVTGDGTLDLIVRVTGSQTPVAIFLNDGCGHFSSQATGVSSRGIEGAPLTSEVTGNAPYLDHSPLITAGTYTVERQEESRRPPESGRGSRWASSQRFVSTLPSSLHSNRAPPVA